MVSELTQNVDGGCGEECTHETAKMSEDGKAFLLSIEGGRRQKT